MTRRPPPNSFPKSPPGRHPSLRHHGSSRPPPITAPPRFLPVHLLLRSFIRATAGRGRVRSLGSGNAQKSKTACERNAEKNKPPKGNQLEANKKAMNIQSSAAA